MQEPMQDKFQVFHAPLIYRDQNPDTVYRIGKSFTDFVHMEWETFGLDRARTLVFFDDHQNHLKRIL